MSKEILLIRNDDGEFELYDDTYDVVIHCKNRQGMKETCEILRKVGTDEKAPNALLIAHGGLVLGRESHGGPEGQKCKGGHMKAHLAFLCNGRCQWCKNYWNCSKTKRLLAKIWGCKDWRWQNR